MATARSHSGRRHSGRRLLLAACALACCAGVGGKASSPYETLGLKRGASDDDVKRAYKKAALRYHPDRQAQTASAAAKAAAEARFKQVGEAYEVLSDPDKRRVFDQYGEPGLRARQQGADFPPRGAPAGGGFGGGGAPFGYGGMPAGGVQFGAFGPGGVSFTFSGRPGAAFGGAPAFGGGADLDDLVSAFFGGPAGAAAGFSRGGARRPAAAGARRARAPVEVGCTLSQLRSGCAKRLRVTTRGESTVVELRIPPGARPGALVRAEGAEGAALAEAGLAFRLSLLPHAWLEWDRTSDDLVWRCALSRAQARARKGVRLKLRALDGRELVVSTKGMRIWTGARHAIAGEGMPRAGGKARGKGGGRAEYGDLVILFSVTDEPAG